jgi:hypothetical protein
VWFVRRRRRSAALPAPSEAPSRTVPEELAEAFTRLEAALAEAGRARRPTETVAALGDRVSPDAAVREAFGVLERALYARTPPSSSECGVAAGELDRASALVLAELRPSEAGRP